MIFGGAAIAKLRLLFCFFYRQPLLSPSFFFLCDYFWPIMPANSRSNVKGWL